MAYASMIWTNYVYAVRAEMALIYQPIGKSAEYILLL